MLVSDPMKLTSSRLTLVHSVQPKCIRTHTHTHAHSGLSGVLSHKLEKKSVNQMQTTNVNTLLLLYSQAPSWRIGLIPFMELGVGPNGDEGLCN